MKHSKLIKKEKFYHKSLPKAHHEKIKFAFVFMLGVGLLTMLSFIVNIYPHFSSEGAAISSGVNNLEAKLNNGVIEIWADIPQQTVHGFSFSFASNGFEPCSSILQSDLPWEYQENSCTDRKMSFGMATGFSSKSGRFLVLKIIPDRLLPNTFDFSLSEVYAYAENDEELFHGAYELFTFYPQEEGSSFSEEDFALDESTLVDDTSISTETANPSAGENTAAKNERCLEKWTCSEWDICINNQQVRQCTDVNNCGTNYLHPKETRNCVIEPTPQEKTSSNLKWIWLVGIIVIILLFAGVGWELWRRRRTE